MGREVSSHIDSVGAYRYLIVGGAGKAGTTSLFYYLKAHPEVCAATVKETGFFLDPDFPASVVVSFREGPERFAEFFPDKRKSLLRIEATPSYLHSPGTARRIWELLPESKVLFSLREPISFVVSTFRFLKQIGAIPTNVSFAEYVKEQFRRLDTPGTRLNMLTVHMCRYSLYLEPYVELFGWDGVKVIFYEDLVKSPAVVLKDICTFAGVDPGFYDDFRFRVHNQTGVALHPWAIRILGTLRDKMNRWTYRAPRIHELLRVMGYGIERVLTKKKGVASEELVVSRESWHRLEAVHAEEKGALAELLGREVPWTPYRLAVV